MSKLLKSIDTTILFLICIFSITIAVGDTLGLDSKFAFFKESKNYSILSVLILSVIGLYLVSHSVTQSARQNDLTRQIEHVVHSLNGVKIKNFSSAIDMENYLASRILQAKELVCDFSWKDKISSHFALQNRIKSHSSYDLSISKISKKVVYKEIFIFSDPRRLAKLKRRLEENKPGYSCRYFPEYDNIPRIQFVLIDNTEIIFASSSYPKLCAIEHPALSDILKSYFDNVWERATWLKEGNDLNSAEIEKLNLQSV